MLESKFEQVRPYIACWFSHFCDGHGKKVKNVANLLIAHSAGFGGWTHSGCNWEYERPYCMKKLSLHPPLLGTGEKLASCLKKSVSNWSWKLKKRFFWPATLYSTMQGTQGGWTECNTGNIKMVSSWQCGRFCPFLYFLCNILSSHPV